MTTRRVETLNGGDSFGLDASLFIAAGTEGEVYRVPGHDSLVIKIYKEKVDAERAGKLNAMVANPPDDPMKGRGHASIAWPRDLVIWPGNREVCGFVMPRLPVAHPISRFYDIGDRRKHLPFFTYQSLCVLASNLASAVWALHEKGYVIGDVNDRNIMATDKALVTVVDTDSFQIKDQSTGRVYHCPVFSPLYTAPEFLGQGERTPEHDLFGIGVLLFQLLMEGQLPFICAFSNPSDAVDAFECLKKGYFPYAQSPNGIKPPLGAPPYAMLHPALQRLFEQCFVDGHRDPRMRPTAPVWRRALRDCGYDLTQCKLNSQHHYFNHLQKCPWCERAQFLRTGKKRVNVDPFPQPGTVSGGPRGGHAGAQTPISTPRPRPNAAPAAPVTTPPLPSRTAVPAQPPPVALNPIAVKLDSPMALHSAQLALLKTLQLKQPATPLLSPMRLKENIHLDGYQPSSDVTIVLNYA
jgi:DNA-binding helix-hairpin-helix protein with protein kinase domain